MIETWVTVKDYPNYACSSFGRFKKIGGKKPYTILKPVLHKQGYCTVALYSNGQRKSFLAHRVILGEFTGYRDLDVNHKNGDKLDNRLVNLEWCTRQQNLDHAKKLGLTNKGNKHYKSYLCVNTVKAMRNMYDSGANSGKVAKFFNVNTSTTYGIVTRRRWINV